MIARTQTTRVKLRSALRHAVIVLAGVFVVGAGALSVQIILKNREALDVEGQNVLLKQQIRTMEGEIARADRLVKSPVSNDLSAVAKLQSKFQQVAAAKKCTVVEFRASSELSPYLTRFSRTTNVKGWGQVNAQVSISGSAKNVGATFAGLMDADIPFEFDSLEITREKTNDLGEATVIGRATLRVLIRTAKEAA